MTEKKDFYKLKIGDTSKYSPYITGGVINQHLEPVAHHHKSLAEALQQPLGHEQTALLSMDDDKGSKGWYGALHLAKVAILQFQNENKRLPGIYSAEDAEAVVQLAKDYNASMRALHKFCGPDSAMALVNLNETSEPAVVNNEEQKEKISNLQMMGADEQTARIALSKNGWDPEMAMMAMFDPESIAADIAKEQAWEIVEGIRKIAMTCAAELQPMACFFGGIVAQEIVKFGGKFVPMNQWGHYDCLEVLPDTIPTDNQPKGSRYDHNISVFGQAVQDKILNSKTFMVGCGALGCEFIKNFAMLGIACGEDGLITVTDGDAISVSNLNRQFLFRAQHVSKFKTNCASGAAKVMNPDIKIDPLTLLAKPDTENTFGDDFWVGTGKAHHEGEPVAVAAGGTGIDFVTNALDSVPARKYVDSRCVYFQKPLLESGTEGTKFNTMVVLPRETVSYDEGEADIEEGEAIPMCTLRSFPSTIVHCIEWARSEFNDRFESDVATVEKFLKEKTIAGKTMDELRGEFTEQYAEYDMVDANDVSKVKQALLFDEESKTPGLLESIREAKLVKEKGFAACVEIAIKRFYTRYNHSIQDLIKQYPEDAMVKDKSFWAPPKRFPSVCQLDMSDELHSSYIISTANLYAVAYGIQPLPMPDNTVGDMSAFADLPWESDWRKEEVVAKLVDPGTFPQWVPSSSKIAAEDDDEEAAAAPAKDGDDLKNELMADCKKIQEILDEIEGMVGSSEIKPQVADFEKDIDINFHIDFVTAAANLRAINYGIGTATRHKTKVIAGKIIAAIATSTASATGLVCIEILKLLQGKSRTAFKNATCNYASNTFQMAEPLVANVVEGEGEDLEEPDPLTNPEAYDETGIVKPECIIRKQWVAIPSPHNKWMKIDVPAGSTLKGFRELLAGMDMQLSSMSIHKTGEDGKKEAANLVSVSSQGNVDDALLIEQAPVDVGLQKATIKIMQCADIKDKQNYIMRWKELQPDKVAEREAFESRALQSLLAEEGEQDLAGKAAVALQVLLSSNGKEVRHPPVVLALTQ